MPCVTINQITGTRLALNDPRPTIRFCGEIALLAEKKTKPVQEAMAKSATQEMATEIARIAQTRVVQVEGVQLTCYQVEGRPTLKKVKSTLGDGWCFDNLFFPTKDWFDFLHAARVFVARGRATRCRAVGHIGAGRLRRRCDVLWWWERALW